METLCAVFCAYVECIHNGATPPMIVKFACAFAAFCAIVRSNIVFFLCLSALSHMNVFD